MTDPKDIRIIETDPSGDAHEATHLTLGDNETHFYSIEPDINEEDERGGWGNQLDFLFSCISVSVGLGSKFFFWFYKSVNLLNLMGVEAKLSVTY